ncbi:MAG: DNA translocase FtsK 4TM domain-containing protein [Muribaculaceae bacterium]|nr:DNA translocase FtsK 4TM domain-containing protein [Muribaculaceae bacterium]
MPSSYSPIDETSYTDSGGFDPAAVFNPAPARAEEPVADTPQPEPKPAAAPEPEQTPEDVVAPRRPGAISRFFAMLADSRSAMFLGVILTVVAAFAFLVCMSYFMNIDSDQSAMLNADYDPTLIRNAGGPVGAWLAHTLIHSWLGMGAFILIYYVLVCGLSLLKVYRPPFWSLTMRCLLGAVSVSVIAGLVTYSLSAPFYWGGMHGLLLNQNLILFSGFWGALGVSLILAGMMVILYLNELSRCFRGLRVRFDEYSERQAQRRAERELRAEQRRAEIERLEAEAAAERAAERAAEEARIAAEEKAAAKKIAAAYVPAVKTTEAPVAEAPAAEQPVADEPANVKEVAPAPAAEEPEQDDIPLFIVPTDQGKDIPAVPETGDEDDLTPLFGSSAGAEQTDPLFSTPAEAVSTEPFDPTADLSRFEFPSIDLLKPATDNGPSVDIREMEENKRRLTNTLHTFGVEISKIEATIGPTVTLFEIVPAEGVRTRSIRSLGEDLQLKLAAEGVRIIAPIPAKGTIGIEVPNKDPQVVSMRSVIDSEVFRNCKMELPMALGKTISNQIFMADLAKMPHLLVAGATGMGKSVGLNAIITSLLYKKHPAELKFVLIDPKRVELSLYRELERHYLAALPGEDAIITDMSKVVNVLNSLCIEMDNRLSLLEKAGARNIKEYNEKFKARKLNPNVHRFLPYIVLVIDEFADLIIRQGKEIENPVSRLAAVARAAGIHLIIATQRPTVNVITGGIKLNIPGRIAFRVIQGNDSRTILDQLGANQLIGRGDMLFSINGKLERVQCAFIDTPEVSAICENIGRQVGYEKPYILPEYQPEGEGCSTATIGDRDPLFDECARLVVSTDTASTSSLQRRYSIGYNRAGKIMDQMEAAGIVGPSQGGKPRQVLIDAMTLERVLENK